MKNSTYLDYIEQETVKVVKNTPADSLSAYLVKFVQEKCLQSYKSGYKNAKQRYSQQK